MLNDFQFRVIAVFALILVIIGSTAGSILSIIMAVFVAIFAVVFFTSFAGSSWLPTPRKTIEKVISVSGLRAGMTVYDLGCGDGRFVAEVAKKTRARTIGIEIDPIKCAIGNLRLKLSGGRGKIIRGNFFSADISDGDVIFCYLPERTLEKLLPKLRKLKKGSRIITYQKKFRGVKPAKELKQEEIYIYRL